MSDSAWDLKAETSHQPVSAEGPGINHSSFLELQIAPAEGPDVSERMVIITGPPEAQFKVSAKDHVSPAGSGSRADRSEILKFWGVLVSVSPAACGRQTPA